MFNYKVTDNMCNSIYPPDFNTYKHTFKIIHYLQRVIFMCMPAVSSTSPLPLTKRSSVPSLAN